MKNGMVFAFLITLVALALTACSQAEGATDSAPTATVPVPSLPSGPDKFKTYTSNFYGYRVSYPANWTAQIDASLPAKAGSNPEYVTLAADQNSLPKINIEALTGTPPMVGFENCEKNFLFRNLPACLISLPKGQNPAAEVLIFQNGSANFFIAMQYEDPKPMQLFNDFLASFEFNQ